MAQALSVEIDGGIVFSGALENVSQHQIAFQEQWIDLDRLDHFFDPFFDSSGLAQNVTQLRMRLEILFVQIDCLSRSGFRFHQVSELSIAVREVVINQG